MKKVINHSVNIILISQFLPLVSRSAESGAKAKSKGQIKIAAYEIPGVMEKDLSGTYDKVFKSIFSQMKDRPSYIVTPTARAEALFAEKKVDCIAPLDIRYSKIQTNVMNSDPINLAKIFIYSRTGEGPWSTLEELKGKRIGIKNGLWYGPKWNDSGLVAETVVSDEQNIEKLRMKRIDAFLAYVPDMTVLKFEKNIPLPNHNPKTPFDIHNDALLCYHYPKLISMIKEFNEIVRQMKASGELKKLLGITYVE